MSFRECLPVPGMAGLAHAAPKAYSIASCICVVRRGIDGHHVHTQVARPMGNCYNSTFCYVLKQTSDEATPTLEPYGGQ